MQTTNTFIDRCLHVFVQRQLFFVIMKIGGLTIFVTLYETEKKLLILRFQFSISEVMKFYSLYGLSSFFFACDVWRGDGEANRKPIPAFHFSSLLHYYIFKTFGLQRELFIENCDHPSKRGAALFEGKNIRIRKFKFACWNDKKTCRQNS